MARWLLLTWDGAGNQAPMTALAQALSARGDAVTVAGYGHQRDRFESAGFAFRTLPRAAARYPSAPPPEGWMAVLPRTVWACEDHAADLDELLAEDAYTGVVADCLMFGALAALETAGTPAAVLVHSAPGALVPPGGPMDVVLLPAVNALRTRTGHLPLYGLQDAWKPFPALCTTIPELDPRPAPFTYIGPLIPAQPESGWHAPWDAGDPRPLVLASFSTGRGWDQASRVQRTLDALAGGPYRVLATTAVTDTAGLRVPANAAIEPWIPHPEIVPWASAVVTHAGHGTVAAALTYGVPLVCLPNPDADQPALAKRVADLGAGVALDGETATPAQIAEAVRTVVDTPSYAASAGTLAIKLAQAPGPEGAATRLTRITVP